MMKLPHLKKLGRKMLVTLPCCLLIRIILKLSMTMVSIFPYFPAREWLILIFFKHWASIVPRWRHTRLSCNGQLGLVTLVMSSTTLQSPLKRQLCQGWQSVSTEIGWCQWYGRYATFWTLMLQSKLIVSVHQLFLQTCCSVAILMLTQTTYSTVISIPTMIQTHFPAMVFLEIRTRWIKSQNSLLCMQEPKSHSACISFDNWHTNMWCWGIRPYAPGTHHHEV